MCLIYDSALTNYYKSIYDEFNVQKIVSVKNGKIVSPIHKDYIWSVGVNKAIYNPYENYVDNQEIHYGLHCYIDDLSKLKARYNQDILFPSEKVINLVGKSEDLIGLELIGISGLTHYVLGVFKRLTLTQEEYDKAFITTKDTSGVVCKDVKPETVTSGSK